VKENLSTAKDISGVMSKYFYVYYSYEEYGKGYIGKRECKCLPEEDVSYFGSFRDKTFKPTQKIILETFDSVEEALQAECALHSFYEVDRNPHFANKAKQTSHKFYYKLSHEEAKKRGQKVKEKGWGICGLTREERIKNSKLAVEKNKRDGGGFYGLTDEQRTKNGKLGSKKAREMCVGIYALTPERRSEISKKAGKITGDKLAKEFVLKSPTGEIIYGKNIRKFCRENNLDHRVITKVLSDKYPHSKSYKGWTKP
jgi:hypothetical protein